MEETINIIDLFCGAGGFSQGFKLAGYDIKIGIDFDKNVGETFSRNHENTLFLHEDISSITGKHIIDKLDKGTKIDCIIGGPPCQGFSVVGNRDIDDPRNKLYKNFIQIVDDIRPKVFVMENVSGLLTMAKGTVIKQIEEDFNRLDYHVSYRVMNASEYGIPQNRKRVIFIGLRKDLGVIPSFPEPLFTERKVTIGDTLLDLPQDDSTDTTRYISQPQNAYQALMRKTITIEDFYNEVYDLNNALLINNTIYNHNIEYFTQHKINKMIEHKERHLRKGSGFGMRFFSYDKVGYTLTSHFQSNYEMLHPIQDRPRFFTVREGARIQGYMDDYIFYGGKTSIAKQIGNSVPVLLSYCIARHIKNIFKTIR